MRDAVKWGILQYDNRFDSKLVRILCSNNFMSDITRKQKVQR